MSAGWYNRPPLEEFTRADWMTARTNMNDVAYKKLRSQASRAGLLTDISPFTASFDTESQTAVHMRSLRVARVEEFNKKVMTWGNKVRDELRRSVKSTVRRDRNLSKSIRVSYRLQKGELSAVGFNFIREGAWIHYGAGKGYGGDGSRTQWYDPYGKVRTARQDSLYKAGTGNRKAINWFNPVIERHIGELADIVAAYSSDITINLSNIYMH